MTTDSTPAGLSEHDRETLPASDVAEIVAETAARIAVGTQISYAEALDALMRVQGYVPASERGAAALAARDEALAKVAALTLDADLAYEIAEALEDADSCREERRYYDGLATAVIGVLAVRLGTAASPSEVSS